MEALLSHNYFALFSAACMLETAVFFARKSAPLYLVSISHISCQSRSKANQHISYQLRSIATVYLVSIMEPAYLVLLILFQFCSNFVRFCFTSKFVPILYQFCPNFVPTQVQIGFFAFLTSCWFEKAV